MDSSKHIIYKHLDNNPILQKYTTVSCQFAIHYFFESKNTFDNLIDILDNCLDDNGTFIITYMDSTLVNNLFTSSPNKTVNKQINKEDKKDMKGESELIYKEDNGNIVYLLKKSYNDTSMFGNKLKIFLDGNNILNETSDEYLVNSQFLISYMKERGYTLVESDYFTNNLNSKNYSLNDFEKKISGLNMYNVFKKNKTGNSFKKEININYTTDKSINVYKEDINIMKDESHTKVIELDDLTLLSVNNSYQIYDLLNCKTNLQLFLLTNKKKFVLFQKN